MNPIPKGVRNKHRYKPQLDVGAVTVPCAACGEEFSGEDGLSALVILINHMRGRNDPRHQKEYQALKEQAMAPNGRTDA